MLAAWAGVSGAGLAKFEIMLRGEARMEANLQLDLSDVYDTLGRVKGLHKPYKLRDLNF